jgi:hypothetical protein
VIPQTKGEKIGYPIKVFGTIRSKWRTSNQDKFQMDQNLIMKHETIKILKENMKGFQYKLGEENVYLNITQN